MPMNFGPFQQQMALQQQAQRRPAFNPQMNPQAMGQQGLGQPGMSMNLNPGIPGNPSMNMGMGGSMMNLAGQGRQQAQVTPGYQTGGVVNGQRPGMNAVQQARGQQGPPPVLDPSQSVLAAYNQGR